MNKLKYSNKNIKEYFYSIASSQPGLNSVMLVLLQKDNVIVQDIINDSYRIQIIVNVGKELINVMVDFLKNKIYVVSPNKSYKEIYDNYPKKHIAPIGYEYQVNERILTRRNIPKLDDNPGKKYHFELNDNNHTYNIMISDYSNTFNEDLFIKKVLSQNVRFNNIRDIFMLIINYFNSKSLTVQICDGIGSSITVKHGEVTDYIEYRETDNEYQKITLEKNEFYIERKIKEVYSDNLTSYIKKLGECDGKEKR